LTVRRLMTALIIALVVSGLFTFWLSRRVGKTHSAPPVQKLQYVAASHSVEAGQTLKAENLQMVDWPANIPIEGAFAKPEPLVGRAVVNPLAQGVPILEPQLATPGAGVGLSAKIPDGMRAISVHTDEVAGVAGFLLPGTRVDVLVTYKAENAETPVTATVLQDAEILTAGQQTKPDPEGKAASVSVVTLLLKPMDAERVVLAAAQGTIHFVLRNNGDRAQLVSQPVNLAQLTQDGVTRPPANLTHKVALPPQPKRYVVETILGTKQTTSSFE
jgi:pilus assembly protein CpaB